MSAAPEFLDSGNAASYQQGYQDAVRHMKWRALVEMRIHGYDLPDDTSIPAMINHLVKLLSPTE